MVEEARLEASEAGIAPVTEGWFVVNVRDAAWVTHDVFGAACIFEGDDTPSFPQLGFTLAVVGPGQPSGLYHRETNQEDFLVLAGECLLLVQDEERPLRAGDFVHCPPGTDHVFVGTGDGPCVIFMAGARSAPGPGREQPPGSIVYPRSELALRHGAGVETETSSPPDAYEPYAEWRPGPPAGMQRLPWT